MPTETELLFDDRASNALTDNLLAGLHIQSLLEISAKHLIAPSLKKKKQVALQSLLDQLPCGITVVSPESQIIIHNNEFRRMFDFPDDLFLKNPVSFDSLQQFVSERGLLCDVEIDKLVRHTSRGDDDRTEKSFLQTLLNGTVIQVNVTFLPDGTALSSYVDVTESRRKDEQILLASRVLAHCHEALIVTDSDGLIINVNKAFCTATGYTQEEVVGKTPRILKSRRHDEEFYRRMWQSVNETGSWTGEIWDKRKNGEIYPKRLSITAVRDSDGKVVNYIGCFTDISAQKAAEEEIRFMAHHDPLTNLPNRLAVRERFNNMLHQARESSRSIGFLFLDLDHFKRVNDSLGHRVGDLLLVETVKRLRQCLRGNDIISRQGGDEFIVILGNIDGADTVVRVVQKINTAFTHPFNIEEHKLSTSVSIGVVLSPEDGECFDTLMQKADAAMYVAKESARGSFSFFHQSMTEKVNRRLILANNILTGLSSDEFSVVYQPQVFSTTGRVLGSEALLRWNPTNGQSVSPLEFIPVAEESGNILPLGEWVINQACIQARKWIDTGLNIPIGVNVSGVQIYRSDLVETILKCTKNAGITPESIQIELTESTLIEDCSQINNVISDLKRIGATVAIDDFGTGFSSLSYLKRFKVDKLKIDRGFIVDACSNEESSAIAKAIVGIAQALRLQTIAEGVENPEQVVFLEKIGCTQIQGFHFSKPLSPVDFFNFAQRG